MQAKGAKEWRTLSKITERKLWPREFHQPRGIAGVPSQGRVLYDKGLMENADKPAGDRRRQCEMGNCRQNGRPNVFSEVRIGDRLLHSLGHLLDRGIEVGVGGYSPLHDTGHVIAGFHGLLRRLFAAAAWFGEKADRSSFSFRALRYSHAEAHRSQGEGYY
jgi:hypothetical protein